MKYVEALSANHKTTKSTISIKASLLILSQLFILWAIIYLYNIEPGLYLKELLGLVIVGFGLNLIVSNMQKLIVFLLLSIAALILITGVLGAILTITTGVFIIYIATRDAIDIKIRLVIIASIAAVIVYGMVTPMTWLQTNKMALSVLGSMFLFRLSIFLYDRYNGYSSPSFLHDLSYFFMLPNMGILLFPVIDYKVFNSSRDKKQSLDTFNNGIYWISTGLFHLLIYRIAYYFFTFPIEEISLFYDYWYHIGLNYFLIIRLSGIFHFSVGLLCVLGYNLPPAFDNYFLASSFTDLWRRINIYFRDYMVKLYYLPIFFKLRSRGNVAAKIIATLTVFAISWFLHSAQFFWLQGNFPVRLVDMTFWGVFGLLVVVNVLFEKPSAKRHGDNGAFKTVAKIIGMYMIMSLLWSLWSSKSLSEWFYYFQKGVPVNFLDGLYFVLFLALLWLLGSLIYWLITSKSVISKALNTPVFKNRVFWSLMIMGGISFWQIPPVKDILHARTSIDLDGFYSQKLNRQDEEKKIASYYEEILDDVNMNSMANTSADGKNFLRFKDASISINTSDIRRKIHKPNFKDIFKGKPYTINSYGMRSRNHPMIKPKNTYRYALLGGSYVCGSGISDQDVFDYNLEKALNNSSKSCNYEFWNFAIPGFDIIQCYYDFKAREAGGWSFDRLIYFSHGVDVYKNMEGIIRAYKEGIDLEFLSLDSLFNTFNLNPEDPYYILENRVFEHKDDIIRSIYKSLYDYCIDNGIQPTWVYWPMVSEHKTLTSDYEYSLQLAQEIGYECIVLDDLYDGIDYTKLVVGKRDHHPNKLGHDILAERLKTLIDSMPTWQCDSIVE